MLLYVKRAAASLFFISGLIGILFCSSFVFEPKSNAKGQGMEETEANGILGEDANSVDVLILGDSETYASFIPLQIWNETGYTSYVCGTSRQTLDYTDIMMKRAFSRHSPKIVILETNIIYREQSRGNVMFTKLSEEVSIFRYHDRWKKLALDDFKTRNDFSWTDDYKGFRYSTMVQPCSNSNYMSETKEKAKIPSLNHTAVKKLKKYCDENGAKFILISTPSPVNWNTKRHNSIVDFAKELNCEYIDMNYMTAEIPIDWTKETKDCGDHLNYYGAKKVTSYLSKYLQNTGLLESHKNDPEYSEWNDALNKFYKIAEK